MQFSGENSIEEALMQSQVRNSRELALMRFAKKIVIDESHMQVVGMMKMEKKPLKLDANYAVICCFRKTA